jgi:hypothetical protein
MDEAPSSARPDPAIDPATLYERLAGELERFARIADDHAGRLEEMAAAAKHEQEIAAQARTNAGRARAQASRLRTPPRVNVEE